MLYLNPPFPIIRGVSLLPDHADPLLYYYLPMAPGFTRVEDPATHAMVPQVQLVKFKGAAGNGGVLSFDVNIGADDELLKEVASECRSMLRLRDTPVLSPVPLVEGTVKMMMLGRESGAPVPPLPTDTPGPNFVVKISHSASPALFGRNQAAFSVMLGQDGVTVLEQAMKGELSPIGIVYSLGYLALRPAYNVQINVKWDRVQKHLDEQFSVNTPFFGSQIDTVVDKLIEERIIEIQVDTFVPEDDDSSSIIGRRDQAVNEIRDMITDAFFTSSLDPNKEAQDGWKDVSDFHSRMTRMGAMGPGSDPLFSYKKLDYTRIDRKSLNVRMNERSTVKRNIYPQGHLSGLFRELTREGLALDRFVVEANLDNPFFARRRVKVISRADYASDSITSVNVALQYGADKKNVILDAAKNDEEVSWTSLLDGGAMVRDLTSRYTVTFRTADRLDRPVTMTSEPRMETGDVIEVSPRELYSIAPVKVMVLKSTFPWDRISHVEVALRYRDPANNIQAAETVLLDKDNRDKTWPLFLLDAGTLQYQYKLVYHMMQGKDLELPWTEAEREQISVPNPFAARHAVEVTVASAVWADTDRVFVDVSYEDPEHDIFESKPFKFKVGDADQSFVVDLADPQRRVVHYVVTFLTKDGRTLELPPSATRRQFIAVSQNMKGHRVVTVRPKPVSFAAQRVTSMKVDLHYKVGEEEWSDQFTFESAEERNYFEFNYSDPTKLRYRHQETYFFANGLSRATDWVEDDADELILPVG